MAVSWAQLSKRIPKVTGRQIGFWCAQGYLVSTSGTGHPRMFTDEEARIAVVMARLVDAGITTAKAARVARAAVESVGPSGAVKARIGEGVILTITDI